MYKIVFTYEHTEQTEERNYTAFADALYYYIEFNSLPWWDKEFKEIKILKNNRELTTEVNKFLLKKWRG